MGSPILLGRTTPQAGVSGLNRVEKASCALACMRSVLSCRFSFNVFPTIYFDHNLSPLHLPTLPASCSLVLVFKKQKKKLNKTKPNDQLPPRAIMDPENPPCVSFLAGTMMGPDLPAPVNFPPLCFFLRVFYHATGKEAKVLSLALKKYLKEAGQNVNI